MRACLAQAPAPAWLALAWLASTACAIAPLPAEAAWPGSRLALAALPWVALAGLPSRRGIAATTGASAATHASSSVATDGQSDPLDAPASMGAPHRARTTSVAGACALWIAAALGPLAVAARVDASAGHAVQTLAVAGVAVLVAIVGLASATHRARGAGRHAIVWGVLVLAVPVLAAVVHAADADARGSAVGEALAWSGRASPLTACWEWTHDLEHAGLGLELLAPAAGLMLVWLAARGSERST